MYLRNRIIFVTLLLVTVPFASLFLVINEPAVPAETAPEKPFLVGIEIGWKANVTECKAEIDKVKNYTNLVVLAQSTIMCDEISLNETCDYAYAAGMYIIVYFGNQMNSPYDSSVENRDPYYPFMWVMKAKERYGDHFLGAYYDDEIGGNLLDRGSYVFPEDGYTPYCYANYSSLFVQGYFEAMDLMQYFGHQVNASIFLADYGLYWFDYKAGYDVVLMEFTKNHSRPLHTALCRGAANVQNKEWGVMITWKTEEPPYVESPNELYADLVFAYNSGAKYVVVYDSTDEWQESALTEDHYEALKNFWEYMEQNPDKHGSFKADTVLVLPEDYGFGFRKPTDTIWGYNAADNWTKEMHHDVYALLDEYGSSLDIVYSDPEFNDRLAECYSTVLTWTPGPEADSYPVVNLDTGMGYSTIQEAVNTLATNYGHTIFVKAGVYNENVYIGKAISLVGEDKETTIINGDGNSTALSIFGDGANVTGFTIRNGGNTTSGNGGGIHLFGADNCSISGNTVTECNFGVYLQDSGNNTLRDNNIFGNLYNFGVSGSSLSGYVNDVDSSNTVDGKPICYWVNEHDREVPIDVGYVAVVNCTGLTVKNLQLSNNYNGLVIAYTRNSVIADNTLTSNWEGTRFDSSSGNILSGNDMHDNEYNFVLNCTLANDFGTTNTVDGKSIIVWVDQHNRVVPSDAGYVALIDCTGITVQNLQLSNNRQGVLLINTTNSIINQNTITNQVNGIELVSSQNNTISNNLIDANTNAGISLQNSDSNLLAGNLITCNPAGIYFNASSFNSIYRNNMTENSNALLFNYHYRAGSTNNTITENNIALNEDYIQIESSSNVNNTIYHNNFIDNTKQIDDPNAGDYSYYPIYTSILWDNGSEGNYWSDYTTKYPYATEVGSSGVWDTAFPVRYFGVDYHPLVEPFPIPSFQYP